MPINNQTLCVCLQVHYPDQKSYLITPKKCHFTKLNPLQYKLISEVIISHSLWSGKNFRVFSPGTHVSILSLLNLYPHATMCMCIHFHTYGVNEKLRYLELLSNYSGIFTCKFIIQHIW